MGRLAQPPPAAHRPRQPHPSRTRGSPLPSRPSPRRGDGPNNLSLKTGRAGPGRGRRSGRGQRRDLWLTGGGVGWWCGRMARWGAFVGREGELSRLQSALSDGGLLLVVGDAGIGKTRFVAEGLSRAADGGMLTVGGGCLPLAAKPP